MSNLTPEQQAIFDRVVGIAIQNNELRLQFKTAAEQLHKQPNWDDMDYITESDESPAVDARAALDAINIQIKTIDSNLEISNSLLFSDIRTAICNNFLDASTGDKIE